MKVKGVVENTSSSKWATTLNITHCDVQETRLRIFELWCFRNTANLRSLGPDGKGVSGKHVLFLSALANKTLSDSLTKSWTCGKTELSLWRQQHGLCQHHDV